MESHFNYGYHYLILKLLSCCVGWQNGEQDITLFGSVSGSVFDLPCGDGFSDRAIGTRRTAAKIPQSL